jgi:peptidyl-prolyl cis-trans isomerase SurA
MKLILLGALVLVWPAGLVAQDPAAQPPPAEPQPKPAIEKPKAKAPDPPKEKGKTRVVEEIVARVNNEIISLSDLDRSLAGVQEDARQECPACTPAQLDAAVKEKQQNSLRDLIDQSLLVQKGKDLNINVEPDVVKQMDRIRQQNKLKDMDEFEEALRKAGIVLEDYKTQIRNQILTKEVIGKEVGSRILIGRDEVQKYYDAHRKDFVRPEMVQLREFFLSTEKKSEDEIPKIEEKAKGWLARFKKGDDFEELAKRYSEGTTAKDGGELGGFERGQLSKELEDLVFKMKHKEITDVIRTKTGFLILQVEERFEAGEQPLDKVEGEIQNRLYYQRMQPELRKYLAHLREESYVVVKPGYTDSAAVASTPIVEVEPSADTVKGDKKNSKKSKHKGAAADAGKKAGQ